jgi:hypothetical protein
MNNDASQSLEQDELCIVWQPTLRTIFTKEDIAEIIAAIKSHETANPVSTTA